MRDKVETALYGGGFRTAGGSVLPFALPGEAVAQEEGKEVAILELSAARRDPGCVHFGVCGGCHYQHAEYGTQVEWKRKILAGLLQSAVPGASPSIEAVTGPEWGYRNRIRLRMEQVEGVVRLGYNRRGTNAFLPVRMCPIGAPMLWRAAEALTRLAAESETCGRWLRAASEVELFCTGDESRLQLQLFLRDARALPGGRFAAFCDAVQSALPELAGAGAVLDPELNRRARKAWAGETWGADGLLYRAAGREYWVSRGAFFQVNRFLVDRLAELVGMAEPAEPIAPGLPAAEADGGGLAWDLFAGVGLFSRVLAERCGRVVAVEGGETAARDLTLAARKAGFEARRESALAFLQSQEHQRERPALVVLDPPRAGLGVEGAALLGRSGATRIVYVSCDPETLARDLAVLVRAGYRVGRIVLVDLFPQTYHLETVVWLSRTV